MIGQDENPGPYWERSNRRHKTLFLPSLLSALVLALVPSVVLAAYLLFFN
jgi:hypothetical protein